MGWFGGWFSSSNKKDDSLANLDADLLEFLIKESPVKYDDIKAQPTPRPKPIEEPREETKAREPCPAEEEPKVPAPSLFPDGRYAHLWKTYQRQHDVEAAVKSEQEKVDDIIQGYKQRKARIGRAALENCAMEQWALSDCYANGKVKDAITLCKTQNKALNRCYDMQSKFLKALGYFSTYDDSERDEKLQMHADLLYQQMLEQENAVEAAKVAGLPTPKYPSVLGPATTPVGTTTSTNEVKTEVDKASVQESPQATKSGLQTLEQFERAVAEKALLEEFRAVHGVKEGLEEVRGKKEEERLKRQAEGKPTVPDRITGFLGGWIRRIEASPNQTPPPQDSPNPPSPPGASDDSPPK